jgi:hypothetical protein
MLAFLLSDLESPADLFVDCLCDILSTREIQAVMAASLNTMLQAANRGRHQASVLPAKAGCLRHPSSRSLALPTERMFCQGPIETFRASVAAGAGEEGSHGCARLLQPDRAIFSSPKYHPD